MSIETPTDNTSKRELVERAKALAPAIRERAEAAEAARSISGDTAGELISAGFARMLVPQRHGGSELGIDAWFEAVLEIARADASHAWCASLLAHVPHMMAQFDDEAQREIWADGPDVPIAGSVMPLAGVTEVDGGYEVSGQAPFASGVLHSTWVFVGGFLPVDGPPAPAMFLIPPGSYEVTETWFTAGMRATGSNTIVTDQVFVPASRVLRMSDLREASGPGAAANPGHLYHLPFVTYSQLTFATPMLGAALGAFATFRDWAGQKRLPGGARLAESPSLQTALGRIGADLHAAELLLRFIVDGTTRPDVAGPEHRRSCMRASSRAAELIVDAIDRMVSLGGTASFAESNPMQRAWRDIHFAASHVSLQTETNYGHWAREELGVPRPPAQPFF